MKGKLRILIAQDGADLVAQCMDYDIGAQGHDIETVLRRLALTFGAEMRVRQEELGSPFAGLEPAPADIRRMWCAPTDAIEARIKELEEALAFYANEDTWLVAGHPQIDADTMPILRDKGKQARDALAGADAIPTKRE